MRLWTLGQSTRPADAFLAALRAHGIGALADVRAYPRSRRWPWFDGDALRDALGGAGIAYHWLGKELGGHRTGAPGSPHTALDAFRPYADHMETPLFAAGVARLLDLARTTPTACLCAEKDWRRCHRRFLADRLVLLDGAEVTHVLDADAAEEHAAVATGGRSNLTHVARLRS